MLTQGIIFTMRTLFFILVICAAIIGLIYVANYGVSTHAIPSLQEFIASSTAEQMAEDEGIENTASSGGTATSSELSPAVVASSSSPYSIFRTPSTTLRVQVAKTPTTRERGLSGRESLASDEGLLFIFPTSGTHGFWMKDMNFPIDIVWINSSKKVVGISENVAPETYPTSFFPPKQIQFVLEVNAGTAKKSGLVVGAAVSF